MRDLDAILEELSSYKLELFGPLVDSFLKEIGKGMFAKLGRSRNTGLMPPLRIFVPYAVFRHIVNISVGYGGSMCTKKGRMCLEMATMESVASVFTCQISRQQLFEKEAI